MKKSLRIASAALALTLAASCAVPAFAAGSSSFSKDETVYAVMNGDGSLKRTPVSEHLYNAGGLSSDRHPEHREQRRVHPERRRAGVEHR